MKAKAYIKLSILIFILLVIFSSWYIFEIDGASFSDIFTDKNLAFIQNFISNLLGGSTDQPAFLDGESWLEALSRAWDTLLMSMMAVFMAMVGVIIFILPFVRRAASFQSKNSVMARLVYKGVKALFTFCRSIPELLWATLLIFVMQPGLFTGALALAINHFGILGKITAEQIENLDSRPFNHLRSNGAGDGQLMFYGVLPPLMPKFLGSVFYRMEEIVRSSVVVGFVGTGGLGQGLQLSMSFRQFTSVLLYLICYLIIVNFIDLLSKQAKQFIGQRG